MAVCLVYITDDDVSQNHCVSNCSSTKTVSSSNLSQHILTMIVPRSGWVTISYSKEIFVILYSVSDFGGESGNMMTQL